MAKLSKLTAILEEERKKKEKEKGLTYRQALSSSTKKNTNEKSAFEDLIKVQKEQKREIERREKKEAQNVQKSLKNIQNAKVDNDQSKKLKQKDKTQEAIQRLIKQPSQQSTSFLNGQPQQQQSLEVQNKPVERDFLTGEQEDENVVNRSQKPNLADYNFNPKKYRKEEQENYKKNKEIAMQDETLQNILAMPQSKERDAAKDKYMQDTNLSWRLNELRNKNNKSIEEEDELEQLEYKLLQLNTIRRDNDTLIDDAILDAAGVLSNTYNSAAYNTDLLLQTLFNPNEKLVETRNADLVNLVNQGRMDTTQALNEQYGDWAGFLYQTGLSISDNMALRLANTFLPGASLIGMASNAAASKALDVGQQEDATAFEQLGRGLTSGGIEYLTERISFNALDNLLGSNNSRNIFRGMVKQAFEEGREEGLSYIGNLVADMAFGDEVEWSWSEFGQAILGGAISGGVMGGPANYIGNKRFDRMASEFKKNANVQQSFKEYANIDDISAMTDKEFGDLLANTFEDVKKDLGEEQFNKLTVNQIVELAPHYMTKGEKLMWDAGNTLDFKQALDMQSNDPFTAMNSRALTKQKLAQVANDYGLNKKTVERIAGLVDKTGVNVVFTTDMEGQENADGYYKNGTIYINPNGSKPYMQTLKHELTHHIQYNPEFKEIKNYLIGEYQGTDKSAYRDSNGNISHFSFDELVNRTAQRYAEAGVNLSVEDAEFEALADLVYQSELFADEKGITALTNTHTDSALKGKIANFFDDMSKRFKGDSEYKSELERARDVYVDAISKNKNTNLYENMDENGFTKDKSAISYSITGDALSNIELLKKGKYYKNAIKLIEHTPDWLIALGHKDYPMFMRTAHILSNILTEEEANKMGVYDDRANYHGIEPNDFLKMVESIEDPKAAFEWVTGNKDDPNHGDNEIVTIAKWKYKNSPFIVVLSIDKNLKLVELVPETKKQIFENLKSNYVASTYPVHGKDPMLKYLEYELNGSVKRLDISKKKHSVNVAYNSPFVVNASSKTNISLNKKKSSKKKHYSISNDSKGKLLSEQQQEYFKDSKVVDDSGNLKVMYRGGNEDIDVFDRKKSRPSNLYGRGFYFTDSEAHAKQYGNIQEYYLNITNPLGNENNITKKQIVKLLQAIEDDGEDMDLSNYGYGATVDSIAKSIMRVDDFTKLYDISNTVVGDLVKTVELFNELNGTNYDGFILPTETVVFNSNQIKKVNNTNPTSNPDVRYSIANSKEEALQIQNDLLLKDKLKPADLRTYVKSVDLMDVSNQEKEERINLLLENMGTGLFGRAFVNDYLYAYKNGYNSAQEYLEEKRRIQEEESQKRALQMEEDRKRREEEHNRRTALAKESALSSEEHTQNAIKEFGTTNNFKIAGYILTDGQMLKFGQKGNRGTDHRAIASAFNNDELYNRKDGPGTTALTKFLNEGNIRIIPETNGLDIAMMPTKSQIDKISKFIDSVYGQEFMVDFSDANGNVIDSKYYDYANSKILDDIKEYYSNEQVKYSISPKNSNGELLSEGQRKFFNKSKVVDNKGNLQVVYHGSRADEFNEFMYDEENQTGTNYGEAYYFTNDYTKAKGYSYDVNKDDKIKTYQNERDRLKDLYIKTMDPNVKEQFLNVRIDGQTLNEYLNDEENRSNGHVKEGYLNLTNPLIVDAQGKYYYEVYDFYFKEARENNHDGIIVKNVIDNPRGEPRPIDVFIAFNSNQFKNADNKNPTSKSDIRYSISNVKPLNERLSGDELLNAQDLLDDLQSVNAKIDENGYVTLYHRTTKDAVNKINQTGKMIAKEDGLFFSTNEKGENNIAYGDSIISLKVPVELLELDDIFDDEASVRIPLGNKRMFDVSKYLNNSTKYSISSKYTNDLKDIMKKYGSLQMRNSQEVDQVLSDIAKEIATTGDFTDDNKNALMKLIRENVMASRDDNNGEIYQEIKKQFGGIKLYVDAKYDNFLKRHNLRNRLRGLFTLTSDKANADYSIDSFYNELVENYNGVFEQLDTEEDQLLELAERLKEIKADNRKMQPIGETNEYFFSEEGIVDDINKYLNNMKARINQMPDAVKNRVTDVYTLLNAERFIEKNTRLQNFNKYYFNNINEEAVRTLGVYAKRSENTQKLFQNAIQEVAEGGDITNKTRDALINDLVSQLDKTNEIKLDEYTEQQMKFFKADTDSTFKSIVKDELNNLIRDVQFAMAYADGELLDDKAIKQAQTRFEKQLREETRNTKVKMASEIVGRTPQQQLKKMGVFDVLQTKESFERTNTEFDNGIAEGDDVGQITGLDAATINEIRENGNDNVSFNKTLSQNLDAIAGKNVRLREMLRATIERPLDNAKKRMFDDQKHNLEKLSQAMKKYGIKAGSKESKAVQWYGEGTKDVNDPEAKPYTLVDLQQEFPNKWQDIVAFEKFCRQMYDEYFERINQARQSIYPNPLDQAYVDLANAQRRINEYERIIANNKINNIYDDNFISKQYENLERAKNDVERITKAINNGDYTLNKVLPKRKDYFHHFQEISAEHGNVLKIINNPNDYKISNKLSGLSEGTKPKAKFTGFMQHREHGDYEADAVGGLLKYIPVAEYAIHIDPQTAHLRGIIKAMRDTSNVDDTDLAYTINYFTHFANNLAGKTFMLDRIITDVFHARKAMQVLKAINSKVKGNAILGNMRSAISQFYNLPTGLSMIKNPASMAKGAMQYARYLKGDKNAVDIMNQSSFLQERYFDKVYNELDLNDDSQIKKMATWMMQFGDEVVSRNVWFGAYEDAIAQNMNQQEAISYADNLTRNAVAGRGIGEVPLLQQSEVVKLFAPFQVEVNNQWQYIKQLTNDVVSGGPDEKKKAAWQMFIMFAVTWGMNELREKLLDGNRTGMDMIDAFTDVFNSVNEGDVSFTTTAGRVGGEILSNVPFATQIIPFVGDGNATEALFGDADPTRYGTQNIGFSGLVSPLVQAVQGKNVDLQGLAFDYLTPWGGAQLDRTIGYAQDRGWIPELKVSTKNGIQLDKNEVAGSYADNGQLRYALDDESIPETIRGLLFGTTGTQTAKDYYDNDAKSLSASKTDAYVEARKTGATYKEMDGVMDQVTKFEGQKDKDGDTITYSKGKQTYEYIDSLTMNNKAKETLYKNYALSDTQKEIYNQAVEAGGSYSQLKDAMFDLSMMESIKDSKGRSIANSRGLQMAKYINEMNVSNKVKQVLRNAYLSDKVKAMSMGEVYGRLKNIGSGKSYSSSSSSRSSRKSSGRKKTATSIAGRLSKLLGSNSSKADAFIDELKAIVERFEKENEVR